jgi:hypothetical protein
MTQSPKPDQNKGEPSSCRRNHIAIAVRLCLIPLIPFLFALAVNRCGQESWYSTIGFVFYVIYLCAVGVAFREAVDLISNKGWSSCCRRGRIAVAAGLYLTPWGLHFAFFPSGLGFIMPLFHNLIAVLVLISATLWQAFGFILLIRAKSPMRSFLVILYFILPASFVIALFPLIGPVALTIVTGFCQILRGN